MMKNISVISFFVYIIMIDGFLLKKMQTRII